MADEIEEYLYGAQAEDEGDQDSKDTTGGAGKDASITRAVAAAGDGDHEEAESEAEESESDDDIEFVMEGSAATLTPQRPVGVPFHNKLITPGASMPAGTVSVRAPAVASESMPRVDLGAVPQINGKDIYEVDLEGFEDKPWRKPGADITDYFNFGFVESTWRMYCQRQLQLRQEYPPNMVAAPSLQAGPRAAPAIAPQPATQQAQPMMGMPPMGMPPMGMAPMGMAPMGMAPMGMPPLGVPLAGPMGMPMMGGPMVPIPPGVRPPPPPFAMLGSTADESRDSSPIRSAPADSSRRPRERDDDRERARDRERDRGRDSRDKRDDKERRSDRDRERDRSRDRERDRERSDSSDRKRSRHA